MTLEEVRRIATQAVREQAPGFEVLGVTTAEGGSDYTEILLEIRDCTEPVCRITLGLDRAVSPKTLCAELVNRLHKVGNGLPSGADPRADDMTPSQREEFERQVIHHEGEDPLENAGPASDPEIRPQSATPPDAG
jgi:hypothetical protein